MDAAKSYFANIHQAVTSIFEGMAVTMSYMFRKPITTQYPHVPGDKKTRVGGPETLPDRYRGFLEVDIGICTACMACERACPIECINIDVEKIKMSAEPEAKPVRAIRRFDIDLAKCMFCGLCQEPCPTNALRHTKHFEATVTNIEHLVARFVDPMKPVLPFKSKKGVDYTSAEHGSIAQQTVVDRPFDAPPIAFPRDDS